jgi:DNA-binding response OmpR family regulator
MPGRHIALLVEDEPQMALELGELLQSIGHGHIHAATKEEAERLAEQGEFCYVLLDLQIKVNAESIMAHVEAGQSLLEFLRERYPRRNDQDKYRLPVLVMSGHAKEHYYVVRALQDGADDFITKPVSESKPPFRDKIQEALRKSGRQKHQHCAAIMGDAGVTTTERAKSRAGPAEAPRPLLVVDLRECRVTYQGHEIPTRPPHNLQRQPLLALAVLAGRVGEAVSMAEIADGMFRLGGLRKRPTSPDARDLRYKLLQPFKKALGNTPEARALDQLVESVPGVGLRLNLSGPAHVVLATTGRDGSG